MRTSRGSVGAGMKTSPWIILGSTVILMIAVIVFAVQNTHRELNLAAHSPSSESGWS